MFDWSFMIDRINLQKYTFIENMPRYVIFNNAYPCSMISVQSFHINIGLSDTVDIFL